MSRCPFPFLNATCSAGIFAAIGGRVGGKFAQFLIGDCELAVILQIFKVALDDLLAFFAARNNGCHMAGTEIEDMYQSRIFRFALDFVIIINAPAFTERFFAEAFNVLRISLSAAPSSNF